MPVDTGLSRVAGIGPRLRLGFQGLDMGDPTAQALLGENAQLDLGDIQPASMFGRVVDLQAIEQATCFCRFEGFVQRGRIPDDMLE